jgi:hypothetical protein
MVSASFSTGNEGNNKMRFRLAAWLIRLALMVMPDGHAKSSLMRGISMGCELGLKADFGRRISKVQFSFGAAPQKMEN